MDIEAPWFQLLVAILVPQSVGTSDLVDTPLDGLLESALVSQQDSARITPKLTEEIPPLRQPALGFHAPSVMGLGF